MAIALENSKLSEGRKYFGQLDHLVNSTLELTRGYIQYGKSFHMNWQPYNCKKDAKNSMSHWKK